VLSKLDYLALCRSIQVLALLTDSDAKDVEVLDLRHQLAVLHRQTPTPRQQADQVCRRTQLRFATLTLVVLLRQARTAAALGIGGWSLVPARAAINLHSWRIPCAQGMPRPRQLVRRAHCGSVEEATDKLVKLLTPAWRCRILRRQVRGYPLKS
jgi:hypothetical protein